MATGSVIPANEEPMSPDKCPTRAQWAEFGRIWKELKAIGDIDGLRQLQQRVRVTTGTRNVFRRK